ncbi:sugar phosphate isomerase/epimerase [Flavobacteriaceae bacterium F89]|uniref:Sugar phosphate isomerase/epimerase n=1 Tax=Cerina litoralis TaxID=2874477 RepID=A0AAE3JU72_9FLAO|nr:sugar phosphate isomerase/epimerase [Cerina litoralis]MCG2462107.1 sugar phosphate isomerase/epimerase [Cerina litoralis]
MKKLTALLFLICTSLLSAQEVGLQLYSLRNQFKEDVPGTLKLIHEWGIKYIEGGGTYDLPLEEYKSLLNANQLEMVSVGASYEEVRDNPEKAIETAKVFGAKYVMVAWIPHDGNNFGFEDIKKATDVFNRAGKLLKKEGLTLAYHPHGYEFRPYKNGTLFDYMAKNATDFAFEMDVFWVKQGGADPLALLKKYPKKFVLFHLKDRRHGTKSDNTGHAADETNVVLGTGDVGIKELVAEAKKLGIKYMFIEDESPDVVQQVPKSLAYLKSLE